ncbi:MAG: cysteine--tRNA ligase [Candidatus Neomarinimicrobiota bacterium]
MKFYNSLTRKKEKFIPIKKGMVGLYTCGPTVYDNSHIGNFRTFLFEDLLKRALLAFNYEVYHVMNITDVDDKTIKKSNDENVKLGEITKKYTESFLKDLSLLRIKKADEYPLATDHINEMIEIIKVLIEKKYAYISKDGSVFFKISKYTEYGRLVKLSQTTKIEKIQLSDEYDLDSANDFALWKSYKEEDGDVTWNSPWGKGRPGWHIECSAMSTKYLGEHFDIHCGGIDNKFPHHENELAQSVCALNTKFVNFWLHSEFLTIEGKKMSKSLNNYYVISDLVKNGFSYEDFRFIILSAHYRSKVNFSLKRKVEAKSAIGRIEEFRQRLLDLSKIISEKLPKEADDFNDALQDDLDTPKALAVFFNWIRLTNQKIDKKIFTKQEAEAGNRFIQYFNSIFAILDNKNELPDEVKLLVDSRENHRKNKEWQKSDLIRDKLLSMGWKLKDTPNGPKITKK